MWLGCRELNAWSTFISVWQVTGGKKLSHKCVEPSQGTRTTSVLLGVSGTGINIILPKDIPIMHIGEGGGEHCLTPLQNLSRWDLVIMKTSSYHVHQFLHCVIVPCSSSDRKHQRWLCFSFYLFMFVLFFSFNFSKGQEQIGTKDVKGKLFSLTNVL